MNFLSTPCMLDLQQPVYCWFKDREKDQYNRIEINQSIHTHMDKDATVSDHGAESIRCSYGNKKKWPLVP